MSKGKKRRIFNLYNFAVLMCLVVICASLYVLMGKDQVDGILVGVKDKVVAVFGNVSNTIGEWTSGLIKENKEKDDKKAASSNVKTENVSDDDYKSELGTKKLEAVETVVGEDGNITVSGALDAAKRQFKELGENVSTDDLKLQKLTRDGVEYFYITSVKNSIEIKIQGGEITRVNSATIED